MSAAPLVPAFRGVLIGAIVVLVGVPPTLRIAVYPLTDQFDLPTARADRAATALIGAALLAVVGSATGLAYLQTSVPVAATDAAVVGRFFGTQGGIAWLTEAAIVLIVGMATVFSPSYGGTARGLLDRSWVSKDGWLLVIFCGGLAVLGVVSWQGHSSAIESDLVAIAVKFAHITGAALWTGGLVVLAAVAPRALRAMAGAGARDTGETAAAAIGMIRRFSVVAVAGVALATATGLVIAAWHVPSVAALGSTVYGLGLAAKVALVLVAGGLGGFNRAVLVAHLGRPDAGAERGPFRRVFWGLPGIRSHDPASEDVVAVFVRVVRLELLVLVIVIVVSVFLTATLAPPVDAGGSSVEIGAPTVVDDGVIDAWLGQHGSSFTMLVELAALLVAIVGIAAVGYELVRWRVREPTGESDEPIGPAGSRR